MRGPHWFSLWVVQGGLSLDIVSIKQGQTQLTPLNLVVFFFVFVLSGSSGGSAVAENCFDEAKVT